MNKNWSTFLLIFASGFMGICLLYNGLQTTIDSYSFRLPSPSRRIDTVTGDVTFHNYLPTLPTPLTVNPGWHRLYYGQEKKWIVVTYSHGSDYAMNQLLTIPGWNVVVVGDYQCPSYRKMKTCFSITINNRTDLSSHWSLINNKNINSLKNLGYLFAIRNGATTIYDTEGDVLPLKGMQDFIYYQRFVGLQYSGNQSVFNSFRHFGRSTITQRGFPLVYNSVDQNSFLLGNFRKPLIQQSLINGKTDIELNIESKLVHQTGPPKNKVIFNTAMPPVIVKVGVFSTFDSKSTLFHYDALWALILPVTLPRSIGDIVRSYWTQRLLWEIGGTVGFFPPNSFRQQKTNFQSSRYFESAVFIDFLKKWTCPKELPFFQCVLLLSKNMVDARYWNITDYQLIKNWIKQLQILRYKEPIRISSPPRTYYTEKVVYQPVEYEGFSEKSQHLSKWKQLLAITKLCEKNSYQISSSNLNKASFPNILLIILFNGPYYSNIPYLNMIYGVQFDHMVYCGPDINKFIKASKSFPDNVTFIEKDVMRGQVVHGCISAAMRMNYNVDGYLAIGDDTLLNTWNIRPLPLNKIWLTNETSRLFRNTPTAYKWFWWHRPVGSAAVNNSWSEMFKKAKLSTQLNQTVTKFVNTLQQNTGSKLGLYRGSSDIVYIPNIYRNETILFLDLYVKNKMFLEIAIPTLVGGLCPFKDIVKLRGQYLWYDGKREQVPKLFKKENIFMHPVKLSDIKYKLKNFYCNTFFPLL